MAEIWGLAIGSVAAVGGAVISSQGAKSAANTAAKGSQAAIDEQQRQFDTLLSLTAPQRNIGNQALATLGGIYGYSPTTDINPQGGASAGNTLAYGGGGGGSTLKNLLMPSAHINDLLHPSVKAALDPLGLFGSTHGDEKRNLKAFLNEVPITDLGNGMLAMPDGTQFNQSQLQDIAGNWYGATYHPDGNQSDWQSKYDSLLTNLRKNQPAPVAATPGNALATGSPSAPNYESFFASPDYKFRFQQGQAGVQNTAAAQGGLYSGNALRALTDYGQGMGASEFGNWFNRQAALAGIGQTATNQATQGAMQTGANVGNLLVNQGNTRASGIIDQTNSMTNLVNELAKLWGSRSGAGVAA